MKYFYLIFIFLFSFPIFSNEIEVIELHENKTLDQMVLEQNNEKEESDLILEENFESISNNDENGEVLDANGKISEISDIEVTENSSIDIDPIYFEKILKNANKIKSQIIQNEFSNYLINLNLDFNKSDNRKTFYLIVKYFYEIGNLSRAYSLLSSRDIENDEFKSYYDSIIINYLLSTFQLEKVCNFKDQINKDLNQKNNFIDKIDIFCLILEDKSSEAELLNSIMIETQINDDQIFQSLFVFLLNPEIGQKESQQFFNQNINSELIFLYSAMIRIAELPLSQEFLKVDPLNMAIPIILNRSSPIELRIKAANKSFINKNISIESLSALYQSVDFNSSQLNNPNKTISELSGQIDLLMSYYFQLVNIQIFPSERLEALISFWDFAKINNLEEIAYSLSYKIVDSIEITADHLNYSTQIATSYIFNKNYEKAMEWIDFYENTKGIDEKSTLVKILLSLYTSNNLDAIISIIGENSTKLLNNNTKMNQELLFILFNILNKTNDMYLNEDFENLFDSRLMPSIFIIENIKNASLTNNNDKFLTYLVISINNKDWKEIHPNHLMLILHGLLSYKNTDITKNIIIEILKNYKFI